MDRFEERFRRVESGVRREGHDMHALSAEELDRRWERAKRELQGAGDLPPDPSSTAS